ncbi:hypothetical protein F4803DRAFT_576419 [Xylaria telfairii]|nr:hypothetical protein F4803DRAFT_576419 [Xylaria telfairii]
MIIVRILILVYGIILSVVFIAIIGTIQSQLQLSIAVCPIQNEKSIPGCPPTYYQVLNATIDSTESELRHAYRMQVAKFHPDKSLRLGAKEREKANENYGEIVAAYEVLSTEKRCAYDKDVMKATAPQLERCFGWVTEKRRQKREYEDKQKVEDLLRRQRSNPNPVIMKARERREARRERERKELIAYVVGSLTPFIRIYKNFFRWLSRLGYWFLSKFGGR